MRESNDATMRAKREGHDSTLGKSMKGMNDGKRRMHSKSWIHVFVVRSALAFGAIIKA